MMPKREWTKFHDHEFTMAPVPPIPAAHSVHICNHQEQHQEQHQ